MRKRLFLMPIRRRLRFDPPALLAVIALCAGLGYAVISSYASGSHIAAEPESGSIAGNASVKSDATASGGKFVVFGTGADIRGFGATGNGTTDDAPALRRALAASDAVHIPAGTYLLASYTSPRPTRLNADFVAELRSNQTITADPGAVFKFASGVIPSASSLWGGNLFIADLKQNIRISGLTVDFNGQNNLVPAGRTITGYGLYAYNASHVTVEGVTMRNTPGLNYIVAQAGGDDFRVANSSFINGGTSIPGNTNQNDFSAMYFVASHVTVDRVTITHDVTPFYYAGGIELHGPYQSITNSTINKSWPAVYIAPDDYTNMTLQNNITITGNQFNDSLKGIVFSAGGNGAIDQVNISNNTIRLKPFTGVGEPAFGIQQDAPINGVWDSHHVITNLLVENNSFYDDGSATDAMFRFSQVGSATIRSNHLYTVHGAVLQLASSPWGMNNFTFDNNDAAWRALSGSPAILLGFTGSSTTPPDSAFDAANIKLTNNRVSLPSSNSSACAFYADWSAGSVIGPITITGNALTNIGQPKCGAKASSIAVSP